MKHMSDLVLKSEMEVYKQIIGARASHNKKENASLGFFRQLREILTGLTHIRLHSTSCFLDVFDFWKIIQADHYEFEFQRGNFGLIFIKFRFFFEEN